MKDYIFWRDEKYLVYRHPYPHIIVKSKRQLHGWWPGKRECTSERLLINPYSGCSLNCIFCYARSFPGWFQFFRKYGIIVVAENFDKIVEEQLDSIDIATCGYLSPVTDPFQPLNKKFQLSEKIIAKFVERNIPIEFTTKAKVPDVVLEMLQNNKHNFGQVSILSSSQELNNILVPRGASLEELLGNISRMGKKGIFAVVRIDPIFPCITDEKNMLKELVRRVCDAGAKHIVASVLDIPLATKGEILAFIKKKFGFKTYENYLKIYQERIGNYLNAGWDYRFSLFDFLRKEADRNNITFALCMEYRKKAGEIEGLNKYFMSSLNCEGINIPIYVRKGKKFYPACDCNGNCLNCQEALCGIKDLAMGVPGSKKDWKLKDYRRWSTMLE